jgi:cysteinyl-tRNA synthetase
MSTEESELRDRLARLQQLNMALTERILAERDRLWRKQWELQNIEMRIARMAPILPLAYIGGILAGEKEKMEKELLLDRRRELIREINREKEILDQLYAQRVQLASEIQRVTEALTRIREILTEQEMRRREEETKQRMIGWLIEELKYREATGDKAGAEQIRRRLRELGYPV